MATLLDLTSQGDVGTMRDESKLSSFTLLAPGKLYAMWEKQQWQSHAIDFSQDKRDWEGLDPQQREDMLWTLSSFFVGEERVTTQFSGLVMAFEHQDEEAYLTTQQVDEARHTQFFSRLYEEVIGYEGGLDSMLDRVRRDLNGAFVKLFDEELVQAGQRLIADPSDREAKVDFITTYHMVIEGTLALTGQNFMTEYCEAHRIMPGFVEGFRNVSQDEHRHVAYGTWYLQQAAQDPALAQRIQAKLSELLPIAAGVLVPKGVEDPFSEWEYLGYSSQQINEFAFTALSRRLKVIGLQIGVAA